ncbi:hypothetical protein GCM10010431_01330 [Streptomyces kunmingensis]
MVVPAAAPAAATTVLRLGPLGSVDGSAGGSALPVADIGWPVGGIGWPLGGTAHSFSRRFGVSITMRRVGRGSPWTKKGQVLD